jgi:hypothetical protein
MTDSENNREMHPEQYPHLINRRLQFDLLLWQTPTLALTGEAFLFSIALGQGISHLARVISATLAFIISWASLFTLAMHRTNEIADAKLIRKLEEDMSHIPLHGQDWRDYRTQLARELENEGGRRQLTDRLIARMTRVRGIEVWFWTLALVSVVSAVLLVISIFRPNWL